MSAPTPGPSSQTTPPPSRPTTWALRWLAMMTALFVPATLTLSTVRVVHERVPVELHPSPYGYTVSLLFWLLPDALLLRALWPLLKARTRHRQAVLWTLVILVPLGFLLDLLLGSAFFTFPYTGATLGIMVPVVGGRVPLEEFFFYGGGFMAILLGYVWIDTEWLGRYAETGGPRSIPPRRAKTVTWAAIPASLAVLGAATWYRWKVADPVPGAFPGYLAVLLAVGVLPTLLFLRRVWPLINWQAFGVTSVMVLSVSLLWEATLAMPYQWWGYNPRWMTGIYIPAWSHLPIEEPLLWAIVSWTTVVVYEVVRIEIAYREAPCPEDPNN